MKSAYFNSQGKIVFLSKIFFLHSSNFNNCLVQFSVARDIFVELFISLVFSSRIWSWKYTLVSTAQITPSSPATDNKAAHFGSYYRWWHVLHFIVFFSSCFNFLHKIQVIWPKTAPPLNLQLFLNS